MYDIRYSKNIILTRRYVTVLEREHSYEFEFAIFDWTILMTILLVLLCMYVVSYVHTQG